VNPAADITQNAVSAMRSPTVDEPLTLAQLFKRSAEFGLPDAFNYKSRGEWRSISSSEMVKRAEYVALGLHSLGLRKGDRAAILAPNSPNWTIADAGCQFAGVIDVPIYTTLTPDSVNYILEDSGSRVLFIKDAAEYQGLAPVLRECDLLEQVVLFDDDGSVMPGVISFYKLQELGQKLCEDEPGLCDELASVIKPDDVATLIYTSGTTGEPKGVMLTHANLLSNIVDASQGYAFDGVDTCLSVLPLSHVFERTGMYVYIRNAMRIFYAESIEKVPENLQEVRPTIFIGVPRIFEKVFEKARFRASQAGRVREMVFDWAIDVAKEYAHCVSSGKPIPVPLAAKHTFADKLVYQKLRDFFGGRLRLCITGGAALPDEIFLIFTGAGISIMQGYGLTETSPVITSSNPDAFRVGTVGRPIPNVQVRIAADGEIEVKGPGVMLGYYHKEQATTDAFTGDGWFRTGDIGHLDPDGYLIITDRKKELFKTSGGKYIAPAHIEQMIRGSRFVSQVVLVGNERKFPAALIVPNFEALESYVQHKGLEVHTPAEFCSDDRIIDLFRRQIDAYTKDLAQFEKVKAFALLAKELTVEGGELTPTLKIKRRVVDERYRGVIDHIYDTATKP
jgi:long-chain acyl-CoA synthetase